MAYESEGRYLNRILFEESSFFDSKKILLNIPMRELIYEKNRYVRKTHCIDSLQTVKIGDIEKTLWLPKSVVLMRNGKTKFKPVLLEDDSDERVITFSKGIRLSNKDMEVVLPYCNVDLFEPYVGRRMSMDDPGFAGYRDEVRMRFEATSYYGTPHIKLPMDYFYDEKHTWPTERLYECIIKTFSKRLGMK